MGLHKQKRVTYKGRRAHAVHMDTPAHPREMHAHHEHTCTAGFVCCCKVSVCIMRFYIPPVRPKDDKGDVKISVGGGRTSGSLDATAYT